MAAKVVGRGVKVGEGVTSGVGTGVAAAASVAAGGLPPLCRSDTAPKQKQAEQQGKEFDHGGTSFLMGF